MLLFLCMLDLPWKTFCITIKSCLCKLRGDDTDLKYNTQNFNGLNPSASKNSDTLSDDALISSERKMLKKLKVVMKNSQSGSRLQSNGSYTKSKTSTPFESK